MIGLDTAKAAFHVHGVDETGRAALKRKLHRGGVVAFFAAQPACTVVLEACGAAHHWGRVLGALGHEVKLVPPEAARPFVKRGRKNDAADAAAICEAARRPGPEVKFVPVKTVEQQGVLALHTARALLVKQQTTLANAVRGLAAEFGLTAPQGPVKLEQLIMEAAEAQEAAALPEAARQALRALHGRFRALEEEAATLEKAITSHARRDEMARRLATIPGVGPITASLIAATVTDIRLFKGARHFAAWLGLVPRQFSTGGKTRLGRITKAGAPYLRMLLILGARAVLQSAKDKSDPVSRWAVQLAARVGYWKAIVAIAAKNARMCWAVLALGDRFRMPA